MDKEKRSRQHSSGQYVDVVDVCVHDDSAVVLFNGVKEFDAGIGGRQGERLCWDWLHATMAAPKAERRN